jgi:hypothetical protein
VSKSSEDIYKKDWAKMSKLIVTISESIKGYYKASGESQLPDHEILLLSMQVFSLICGKKWGYSPDKLDQLWNTSQDIHNLVQSLSKDAKPKGSFQEPTADTKPKKYSN